MKYIKFPSPCGVNIVANFILRVCNITCKFVSVPLRGKYRGELYWTPTPLQCVNELVSVPLRGKYRGEYSRDYLGTRH